MQRTGPDGLQPAPDGTRRCTIVPIHGADQGMADGLLRMWATKSPTEVT
jgi:hypothetical protein